MNCLTKAKKLLSKLRHPIELWIIWFFSDEENFCQDQLQQPLYNPCGDSHVMKNKFFQIVVAFGCMRMMSYHYISLNKALGLMKLLKTVVKLWLERVTVERTYVLQQFAISPERVRNGCQRISMTSAAPISCLLVVIPWITICGVWLKKAPSTLPATPKSSWWSRSRRYSKIFLGSGAVLRQG